MCGISGIIHFQADQANEDYDAQLPVRLHKMATALQHRGPDGEGFWINPGKQAGFAHRRLSIIDLSPAAAQPMHYLQRYTIVYNGEIYNYLELRSTLKQKGYFFQSQSDTEVLLAAYDCFKEKCLDQLDGMFAFAIWDEQEQMLFAARDRFGEKPFYYAINDLEFCFASERKALWAAGIEKKINTPLLLNYLVLGYTQTPLDKTITYHQNAYSLPPAHYLRLNATGTEFNLYCYWDCDKEKKISIKPEDAIDQFETLLALSVERRLRSDVGFGTSLSGGLDSSSIVAMIQKTSFGREPIQTFSAVFPGFARDESKYIKQITEKFKCSSYVIAPNANDFIRDFEKLCDHQEEPFSSASIYAQYKVYELASRHGVKVLLDGQGADEILAGYHKYIPWYLQELLRQKPMDMFREKRALKNNNAVFSWGWKNYLAAWYPAQVPGFLEKREARKLLKHPDLTQAFKKANYDRHSLFKPLVIKLNDMLYYNTCQTGLEELLRYADRNSMAHGREVRLPFLNHQLVEFIFSLPAHYKINAGWTKWILRKTMERQLPSEIVWRKDKVGFEPPQKSWMKNNVVADHIREARKKLVKAGILLPSVINKKNQPQDAHAAENEDWRYLVAAAFMP
jgi:asparagine synthase (glutamine-hydrolysing)